MLQSIRDRASGIILWFVVAIIVVPFAFWGISNYFGTAAQPKLATVGDAHITQAQFQNAYERQYRRLMQTMGKQFNPDQIDQQAFRHRVLEGLIQQALMSQQSIRDGYQVNNQQILSYLRQIPVFQSNGKFSFDRYKQVLARQGMTPSQFESELRQSLRVQQLQQGISQSAFVTKEEVDQVYALRHEARKIQYLVFDPSQYSSKVQVSDSDIQHYYDQHKDQFKTPAQVQLSYLDLDLSKIAANVKVKPSDLHALYKQEKKRFTVAAQRQARHILVSVSNGDWSAAKKKIESIRQKIENGASFAAMAKQYSDDTGTADQGGELGWVTQGSMAAPLDKALFSLKPGQVSQPIKTHFGWQLLKLQDVRPSHTKPFDDPAVQKSLARQYRRQQAKQKFQKLSDELDQKTFVNPDSLQPAAKALGLKIQTSDWLAKSSNKGLFQYSKVRKAAFSDTVLHQHSNSRPIDVGQDHEIVVRVNEFRPSKQLPLKVVHAAVASKVRQSKAAAQAKAQAKTLVEKMSKQGGGLAAEAPAGMQVQSPGFIQRDNGKVPAQVVHTAFSMPRPHNGNDAVKSVALGGGKVAVVSLQGVKEGDLAKAGKKERQQLKAGLERLASSSELSAYQRALRKSIGVQVHTSNLPAQP